MTIKKNDKSKNYTPYYIWGLHASLAAIENNKRNIQTLFWSKAACTWCAEQSRRVIPRQRFLKTSNGSEISREDNVATWSP